MNNLMTHINNAIQGLLFDYKRLWINPFAIAFLLLALLGAGLKVIFGLLVMASLLSLIAHGVTSYIKEGNIAYRKPKKPQVKSTASEKCDIKNAESVSEAQAEEPVADDPKPVDNKEA